MTTIKLTLTVILIGLTARAQAEEPYSSELCLAVARFAELAAETMKKGMKESRMKELTEESVHESMDELPPEDVERIVRGRNDVISWIYTVKPSPSQARLMIYTKCLKTGFGHG